MVTLKNFSFLLVLMLSLCACGGKHKGGRNCATEEACLNDPDCQCWCSVKCGYRKKTASDHPVYVEDDPNGKHCYCKQWDIDHYEDNCVKGKKIKEPKDAQ